MKAALKTRLSYQKIYARAASWGSMPNKLPCSSLPRWVRTLDGFKSVVTSVYSNVSGAILKRLSCH